MAKQTVTIEVRDSRIIKLLLALESMDLIHVIRKKATGTSEHPANQLAGSISEAEAQELDKELEKMRNEWERDI